MVISIIVPCYNEHENAIEINNSSCKDQYTSWSYPGIYATFETNARAWSADWNIPAILNLLCNENYQYAPMDENIYNQFFKNKNWDQFEEEQVVCIGDTAYVCISGE